MSERAATTELDRPDIRAAITRQFGAAAPLAARYAELLCTWGIERGMIGPREADRIWERHLLNCASLAPLIPADARVVDLGSGAGLPGIPLAISRPDLTICLLEPLLRRVRFLEDCLAELSLPQVSVHRGRAQEAPVGDADVVVVRAVAALEALAAMSGRLLKRPGTLLALKGEGAADEMAQLQHATSLEVELLTLPAPGRDATVVRVSGDFSARPARRSESNRPRRGTR